MRRMFASDAPGSYDPAGMYDHVARIVYTREVIAERVKELAGQVVGVYRDEPFVVAVTLKGAFIFAADLVRNLPEQVEIVFVRSRSYGDATRPVRAPEILLPADFDWNGRHVLLVEDIVDTGRTVTALREAISAKGAATVRICAFLDKPQRREVEVDVEFTGFTLAQDEFVVGYGLDHAERYRHLPFVGTLKPSAQ